MSKIKRIALSSIAVLATIGVTSPASAIPIIDVTYNFSDTGTTTAAGNTIFDVFFKINLSCPSFVATCSATGNTLDNVILSPSVFDALAIADVQTDADTIDPGLGETLFWDDPIAAFFVDGFVTFDTVGGLAPNSIFNLLVTTVMVDSFDPLFGFVDPLFWAFEFFGYTWEYSLYDYTEIYATLDLGLTNVFDVAVPEPGTLVLFAIGLIGFGAARRRKINSR